MSFYKRVSRGKLRNGVLSSSRRRTSSHDTPRERRGTGAEKNTARWETKRKNVSIVPFADVRGPASEFGNRSARRIFSDPVQRRGRRDLKASTGFVLLLVTCYLLLATC